MLYSDQKIIKKLSFICEFFYGFKSNISKDVIDKSTKLINFMEYCNNNLIDISNNAISEIINYIDIIEKHVKHYSKLSNIKIKN